MSDFRPGDAVVYQPHPNAPREDGIVKRVDGEYVFVLYAGDWYSKATRAADLQHAHNEGKNDGRREQ